MKKTYERPLIIVELFAVNRAIAACDNDTSVIFDCMRGPNTDTASVLTDACTNKAVYVSNVIKAQNSGDISHSSYNKNITWTTETSNSNWSWGGTTKTITATASGASGLLYICATETHSGFGHDKTTTFSTNGWSINNGVLVHSSSHNCTHPMIAPVFGAGTSSVSTGS